MGYFNYFIKCIIRNISYKLCKPKVFLTVLLSVAILFSLKNLGYCADYQLDTIIDQLSQLSENQAIIADNTYNYLISINNNIVTSNNNLNNLINQLNYIRQTQLPSINTAINNLHTDLSNLSTKVEQIKKDLTTVNTNLTNINSNLTNILNTLKTNQKELIAELKTENEKILTELEELKKSLNGDSFETKGVYINAYSYLKSTPDLYVSKSTNITLSSGSNFAYTTFNYVFKAGYTYNFKFVLKGTGSSGGCPLYYTFDTLSSGKNIYANYIGSFNNTSTSFSIKFDNDVNLTLLVRDPVLFTNDLGSWTISAEKNGSIGNLNNSINQGNQLQQEQNQLQQEQNDFLKQEQSDSDVSVDGFNNVDVNDITSNGLTGIFSNIYNSITSWSSKDINLPIPYTSQSIVIPANYTENMLGSFGGSWIITFVHSIYYFIVARFIIYSITNIINSIKSGSILNTDNGSNITTDML